MKKIEVLKRAIEKLEGGVYYEWTNMYSCNCGIVAQCVMNMDDEDLERTCNLGGAYGNLWGGKAENQMNCKITGLPLHLIFKGLFDIGFSVEDINHLENLSDRKVIERFDSNPILDAFVGFSGKTNLKRDNKYYLIKYLKSWVSILEEQRPRQAQIQPAEKVRKVYVVVSPEVKKGELVNGLN